MSSQVLTGLESAKRNEQCGGLCRFRYPGADRCKLLWPCQPFPLRSKPPFLPESLANDDLIFGQGRGPRVKFGKVIHESVKLPTFPLNEEI